MHSLVAQTDGGNGSPEEVIVLAVVHRDERVEQRHGCELEVPVYT